VNSNTAEPIVSGRFWRLKFLFKSWKDVNFQVFVKTLINLTVVIIVEYHSHQFNAECYLASSVHVDRIIGTHQCALQHNRSTTNMFRILHIYRKMSTLG